MEQDSLNLPATQNVIHKLSTKEAKSMSPKFVDVSETSKSHTQIFNIRRKVHGTKISENARNLKCTIQTCRIRSKVHARLHSGKNVELACNPKSTAQTFNIRRKVNGAKIFEAARIVKSTTQKEKYYKEKKHCYFDF